MLTLTSGPLVFSVSEDGRTVGWSSPGTALRQSEGADFWRAYLDDGYEREMTVRSSKQTGVVRAEGQTLRIEYPCLVAENGRRFDITLTVTVSACVSTYPGFRFDGTVTNRCAVRLNELQLPLVDLSSACGAEREKDVLCHCNGLGSTVENPWERIKKTCHTEYISSDHHQIWNAMRYPGDAAMCWFGLQTGGRFLYVGRHDPALKVCALAAGVSPRREAPRLLLTISHLPCVREGETVPVSDCFVALCEGDWRKGSDIYGNHARRTWYTPPVLPDWVKGITGWQRIILRHQFGEVQFTYEDLPRVYEEGRACGLNMLMVFGWWKGRFDNGYPVYEPDPALGGAEKLRQAIADVQKVGGRVALYTNGQLIDVQTDYYREIGKDVCRIDIDGNEYRDHYRFGNDGLLLRSFGYKSFVTACPATDEWQERVAAHERLKFSFGCDSAFFDQIGGAAPLPCFNPAHRHGFRPDEAEMGRAEIFRRLLEDCPAGKAIGTEMVNDRLLPYVHYIHGIQTGAAFVPGCLPEMFLRTFPEVVQTDRFVHDDKEDTDRRLGNAFIHGFRLDVSPYRGRAHIGELPTLREKIRKLLACKETYRRFFYEGRYVSEQTPPLPPGVKCGEFVSGDEHLYALWNDSDREQSFTVVGQEVRLSAQEFTCVCFR